MRTSSGFFDISALEQRILGELAKEVPSKMIAKELGISEASLSHGARSLCRKLGVTGRAQAIQIGRSASQV